MFPHITSQRVNQSTQSFHRTGLCHSIDSSVHWILVKKARLRNTMASKQTTSGVGDCRDAHHRLPRSNNWLMRSGPVGHTARASSTVSGIVGRQQHQHQHRLLRRSKTSNDGVTHHRRELALLTRVCEDTAAIWRADRSWVAATWRHRLPGRPRRCIVPPLGGDACDNRRSSVLYRSQDTIWPCENAATANTTRVPESPSVEQLNGD